MSVRLLFVFLFLCVLTVSAYFIGELSTVPEGSQSGSLLLLVLGLAGLKAQLLVREFMGLASVRGIWAWSMLAYPWVIFGLVASITLLGRA